MEEGETFNHSSVENQIIEAQRGPTKMRIEQQLARRWAERLLGKKLEKNVSPPKECDEWFREYNPKFSELLQQNIREHLAQSTSDGNHILARYETAPDAAAREQILDEIEGILYHPLGME